MTAPGRGLRTGLAVPTAFALAALIAFLALGTWQVERKAWKEALIETLDARLSAAPAPLPARETWTRLTRSEDEFRRVAFSAAFVPGSQALVYGAGSSLRGDVAGPGYWVFALARVTNGDLVVVNRGFTPEDRRDAKLEDTQNPGGIIDMVGVMRWPEQRSYFAAKDDPGRNLWFTRDHLAVAAAKGWLERWGSVAPFFIDLESPMPPGGYPRSGPLQVRIRNEHLQYAVTWYALAAAVAVMYAIWLLNRRAAAASSLPCRSERSPLC